MNAKISVLMGIYNCETTLEQAVFALEKQSYENWELIMCDDGSTDNTYSVAAELSKHDARIHLLRNAKNEGLNKTLNRCFSVSTGEYIARMDGDDDCLPDRLMKQVSYLEAHPEIAIVSSPMILFDETGEWGRTSAPEYPSVEQVVTGSPICHAPVMMRRECMETVEGYTEDPRMLRVEDVNLWIKLYAAGYRCYNIQDPLYRMRNDRAAFKRRKYRYRINSVFVRLQGCRMLKLGPVCYMKAVKPMLIGLVPARIRAVYRRIRES